MRRPDVFTLDYSHPLAQGLVFAGLGDLYRGNQLSPLTNSIAGNITKSIDIDRPVYYNFSSTSYVIVDETQKNLPLSNFTISIFVKTSVAKGNNCFLAFGGDDDIIFYGPEAGPGGCRVFWRDIGGNILSSSIGPVLNKWCLFTLTSESLNSHKLYLDGSHVASTTADKSAAGPYSSVRVGCWADSTSQNWNGLIADPLFYNRALSPAEIAILADRTDPMLGGLIVEERPVLYFDMGGSTTDDLTADDLVVGSPVLGTPALGQIHALTATGLTVSSPVLGSPTLGQIHVLTATGLTVSSPVLGTPTLTENLEDVDVLFAENLVVGSPVLGTPALGQVHSLTAAGLVVGSPVLGTPVLDDGTAQPVTDRQTIGTISGGTVYPIEADDEVILVVIRKFLEVVDAQLG